MFKWMMSLMLMLTLAVYVSGCEKKETAEKSGGQQAASESADAGKDSGEEKSDAMESESEAPEQGEMEAPSEAEDGAPGEPAAGAVDLAGLATAGTLAVEGDKPGASENKEGIAHFKEGHWDVAEKHFLAALAVNEKLAEAHYNLALALDKLGNHGDATAHFKNALELAPGNVNISESQILKDHLGG